MRLLVRVDFYLLASSAEKAALDLACRLLEKAYLQGQAVFVHCHSAKQMQTLDDLLWTFNDTGFIPHLLSKEAMDSTLVPIQIGHQDKPHGFNTILLNLSGHVPDFAYDFKRILELVVNDPHAKQAARQRYREYRAVNWELHTHAL